MATENVPQSRPMSEQQVMNNAGGFGWKVDDMTRLKRFLCLGAEGGTYYVNEKELKIENAQCVQRLLVSGRGKEVVELVRTYSVEGRTAKQNSLLFVLAICARSEHLETKRLAYSTLNEVCRIPTFLFQFVEYCEKIEKTTGWGRAHRKAINSWYNHFDNKPLKLAMLVTKFKNRNNWCHLDVLRLAHTKPVSDNVGIVLRYIVKGIEEAKAMYVKDDTPADVPVRKVAEFLDATEEAKQCRDEKRLTELIEQHQLVREHMPTELLKSPEVWKTLLKAMPMTAMIRNLGKMTSLGILQEEVWEKKVLDKLGDENALREARIHPFNVLQALVTYKSGSGDRGKLKWDPNSKIVNALDGAFYKTFKFVEPTKKRFVLAVDVSGSMGVNCLGSPSISCRMAAAAMMMVTLRTEANCEILAFSHDLLPLSIKRSDSLDEVLEKTNNLPFGGTDCAKPMEYAKLKNKKVDVFIVYTDCETWFGNIHPSEALRQYRRHSNIWDARLVVCGMSSGEFTIADPEDPGMLDVAGFDSSAPEVMRKFIMGEI